jgi:hypothetical protein
MEETEIKTVTSMPVRRYNKPGPKPKPKVPKRPKNKTLSDMRLFHKSLNWAELWEDFYTSLSPSGRPKWRVWTFVNHHAHNDEQKTFLQWYLGPKDPPNPELLKKYNFVDGPLDWETKRSQGGWFTEENLKIFSREIRQKHNALDALRECGNGVVLNFITRLEKYAQKLDKAFNGELFVEENTFAANLARTHDLFGLYGRLLDMLEKAQALYAKSHGVDYNDMAGFAQLVSGLALAAQAGGKQEQTQVEKVLSAMNKAVLVKAHKFKIPLPEELTEVIDVTAEEPINPKKQIQ